MMLPIVLAVTAVLLLQNASTLADRFRATSGYDRLAVLNEPFRNPSTADLEQVRDLLSLALRESDERIRLAAIDIVGSIPARLHVMPLHPQRPAWERLLPIAQEFRPQILAALKDPSSGVRGKAVYAIAALDTERSATVPPVARMSPELAELLEAQFLADESSAVRSWIANHFGSMSPELQSPGTQATARRVLLKALADSDAYVVQFAGTAMFRWRISEALPLLIKQLEHPSPIARMGVAAGLQGYADALTPYLPQLEAAYAKEPEGPARKTLENTIRRAKSQK